MKDFFFIRFFFVGMLCLQLFTDVNAQKTDTNSIVLSCLDSLKTLNDSSAFDQASLYGEKCLPFFAQLPERQDTLVADFFFQLGRTLLEKSDLSRSLEYNEKALAIRHRRFGEIHKKIAESYQNIGAINIKLGNYDSAIKSLTKCLSIREEDTKTKQIDIADTYHMIGLAFYYKNEFTKAISYYEKSMEIRRMIMGEKNLGIAASYTNLGIVYWTLADYNNALTYFNNALIIQIDILGKENPALIPSYINLGVISLYIGNYEDALNYNQKAIPLIIKHLGSEHPNMSIAFSNMGLCHYKMGNYEKSLDFFNKSLAIHLSTLGKEHVQTGGIYNNIGLAHMYRGDFNYALDFFFKALYIRTKSLGENAPEVAETMINIGEAYKGIEDYGNSGIYQEKALDILKNTFGLEHPNVAATLHDLGELKAISKNYQDAINFYYESLNIHIKLHGENHPDIAVDYQALGNVYLLVGKLDSASICFHKALDINRIFFGTNHPKTAELILGFSSISKKNGNYSEALDFAKQALKIQEQLFEATNYNVIKTNKIIGDLEIESKEYKNAIEYLEKALKSLSDLQNKSPFFESKIFQQSLNHTIIENLIHAKLSLNNASLRNRDDSFYYSETGKGNLLLESLNSTKSISVAGIPDTLLQQEYDLRIDIAYYDKKRQEKLSEGASDTDSTVLAIGSRLFDLNREYEALKARFEANYPQYYRAKYDLTTIPLDEVQNQLLQPNQCLLEFMVGDSNIYVFLVRKDTFYVHEIKHDFPLEQWVQDMTKDGIYGYYALPAGHPQKTAEREDTCNENYTRAAQDIYQKLVAPIADQLTDEVIIVPDGVLGYVPFEALLAQAPKSPGRFGSYHDAYFMNKHQISYCYSATLLREMRQKQHRDQPSEGLLAMAPFFLGDVEKLVSKIDTTDLLALRDSLQALPASGEEAASIAKLMQGTSYYGPDASLEKFRENAGNYRFLHLSTHGKADDRQGDYAYLAFGRPGSFDKLYARDLYNYSLNADMVVLSACETGIGKLRKGEGIVSLARAFAYAGAKSIFTTLWQVSDEKTKDLMVYFYKNLQQGKSKDEALRLAKLEFLKKNKGQGGFDHPFFWAGMIGIGDMGAVK